MAILPSLYLGFLALAVLAAIASGGGREVVPREQAVAFPVSTVTEHFGALLLAPLNIAWLLQAWVLLGATSYGVRSSLLPWALVGVFLWILAATACGQVVAWTVEALRRLNANRAGSSTVTVTQTATESTTTTVTSTNSVTVTATNSAGTSPGSAEVTLTPTTVPGAPLLSATPGRGVVSLSWVAPSSGGTPITGYTILRGPTAGQEVPIQTITQGTSYVDGSVTKGASYSYVVRATNARGTGAPSNAVAVTVKK